MPIAPSFRLNTKGMFRDLDELQKHSRKAFSENLEIAGRGVIRNVVTITPPNRIEKGGEGEDDTKISGPGARKQGEAAIMSDLYRIFFPASAGFMKKFLHANPDGTRAEAFGHTGQKSIGTVLVRVMSLDQMRAFHKSKKNNKGRVRGGGEGGRLNIEHARELQTGMNKSQLAGLEYAIVSPKDFKAYAAMIKERVGWLGHGWGPAASRLKVTLPTYMSRHDSSHGSLQLDLGPDKFVFKATNNVAYTQDVRGYHRRLQDAVNRQAQAMRKRVHFYLDKKAKEVLEH